MLNACMIAAGVAVGAVFVAVGFRGIYLDKPQYHEEAVIFLQTDTDPNVLKIYNNGRVEFGPGITSDQASLAFWKKVGAMRVHR